MILLCLIIAVKSAIIGYVYSNILIQPGEILHWLYSYFQKKLTKVTISNTEIPEELRDMVGATTGKQIVKEHWLLKPLGACEKCTAGQIAFWMFLYHSIIQSYYYNYNYCIFTVINHIFTICVTILLTIIIKRLMLRL